MEGVEAEGKSEKRKRKSWEKAEPQRFLARGVEHINSFFPSFQKPTNAKKWILASFFLERRYGMSF